MKSIMEEAPTISKAIEKAWQAAGSPTQFSVKILELPVKTFFGFTTKSAKIAFFFEESIKAHTHHTKPERTSSNAKKPARMERVERSEYNTEPKKVVAPAQTRQARPAKENRPKVSPAQTDHSESTASQVETTAHTPSSYGWDQTTVASARTWLDKVLENMNKSDIGYSTETQKNYLTVILDRSLAQNAEQERSMYSSMAHLLLQAVRHAHQNGYKNLKVVIKTSPLS
jgi:predicted RNA-binding protein Jag